MTRTLIGVAAAIAITAALDGSGLSEFSALPLLPLILLLWLWERLSRTEIGLTAGAPRHYALALLYPIAVMGILAALAAAAGDVAPRGADWGKALANLAIMSFGTFVMAILTEEGFFRGWLWGSLARGGRTPFAVLTWSSLAFALWHVSSIAFPTVMSLPPAQAPIFLLNAFLLGAVWGLMRLISGSVLVASACHGLWNGLAYVLFGFGPRPGALGIANGALYGPEGGLLGVLLNLAAVALLCWWQRERLFRGLAA